LEPGRIIVRHGQIAHRDEGIAESHENGYLLCQEIRRKDRFDSDEYFDDDEEKRKGYWWDEGHPHGKFVPLYEDQNGYNGCDERDD
jgi:hypothetical protein